MGLLAPTVVRLKSTFHFVYSRGDRMRGFLGRCLVSPLVSKRLGNRNRLSFTLNAAATVFIMIPGETNLKLSEQSVKRGIVRGREPLCQPA